MDNLFSKRILYAGAIVLSVTVISSAKPCSAQAILAQVPAVECPHFASTPWVDVGSVHKSGNGYGMVLLNETMTCAQATAWARKLLSQHRSSAPGADVQVGGGPAGYRCSLTPDGSGHWLGGECLKGAAGKVEFIWAAAGD
jgi:hypothetical protein